MNNMIKYKERRQLGYIGLVIVSVSLLMISALIKINSIKATCKPVSGINQSGTEVTVREVVEEPQPQIVEESTTVASEEAPSEPELLEEPSLEGVEKAEPVLVAARESEVTEEAKSEESLDKSEPWITEDIPYESIVESTFEVGEDTKPEPDMIEEPYLEVIEETEPQAIKETDTEIFAEMESEETFVESEPWTAEDTQYESTMESTFVVDTDLKPESDIIEEPYLEVIEETEARAIEETDTEVFAEMESEEILEVSEREVVEEPQPQIIEETTSVAVEEALSEPEFLEESNIESVEKSDPVLVAARETEATEQTESEESIVESEPWTAEDTTYESMAEFTFEVAADLEPEPEPEMIEEPNLEVIEETEAQAIEEIDTEITVEREPEEILVAYEQEVVDEPGREIVEEQEATLSSLLQEVFGERKTANVEGPPAESIEASEPKVAEGSQSEVPVMEGETESVSVRLANIIGGKAGPAITDEPQVTTNEDVKPNEKVSKPEVVEEPRQKSKSVKEQKSIFSYLQEILKSSNDSTK